MSFSTLSLWCTEGPMSFLAGTYKEADHEGCPGSESQTGLIGGWSCSCECHRDKQARASGGEDR